MLKSKWGLTDHDYALILNLQNFGCGVCGRKSNVLHANGGPQDFAVDHDHDTGIVRGLLCDFCNRGLGMFGDKSDTLAKAADYLKRHGK